MHQVKNGVRVACKMCMRECEFHSILSVYLNNESLGMHGVNAAHITRLLPCIFIQDSRNVGMNLHNNLIRNYHHCFKQ